MLIVDIDDESDAGSGGVGGGETIVGGCGGALCSPNMRSSIRSPYTLAIAGDCIVAESALPASLLAPTVVGVVAVATVVEAADDAVRFVASLLVRAAAQLEQRFSSATVTSLI